jgi:hypothetical protein
MKGELMHKKLIALFIGLTLLIGGGTAGAGEKQASCYRILSGKDNLMCRRFLQNMNHFCNKQTPVCEPQIAPAFAKYFSVPKWETVDYKSHLDIIEQYIKIRAIIPINCSGQCVTDTQEKRWQEYKAELLPRLESGQIKLARARVHIRFDDKPRIAYKLVDTICSPDDLKTLLVAWKPGLIIVDEDTGRPNVYYSKTPTLLGHTDVIIYQGDAYFLSLDESLYFPDLYNQTNIECNYQYTGKIGGKKCSLWGRM